MFARTALLLVLTWMVHHPTSGRADLPESLRKAPPESGLIVLLPTSNGEQEASLARSVPVVVVGLTPDRTAATLARRHLARQNVIGQVSIVDVLEPMKLPLVTNSAAIVVADLDALTTPPPERDEMLRVVRPEGRLFVRKAGKWTETVKPRPAAFDDWRQFFKDGAASDASRDQVVGPAYGMQWQAGTSVPQQVGMRIANGVVVEPEFDPDAGRPMTLVARDAFSGAPLWRQSISTRNPYAFALDDKRAIVFPEKGKHLVALDLNTGKPIQVFDQGLEVVVPKRSAQLNLPHWFQIRLVNGRLAQTSVGAMVVLDAATGKKLWSRDLDTGASFAHPVMTDKTLFVIVGKEESTASYFSGWTGPVIEKILALDAATGEEKWTFTWPADRTTVLAYNMTLGGKDDGTLALAVCTHAPGERFAGKVAAMTVDARTGKLIAYRATGQGGLGGHSHYRALIQGDKLCLNTLRSTIQFNLPDLSLPPEAPVDKKNPDLPAVINTYPHGCQVWRLTPAGLMANCTLFDPKGPTLYSSSAARTACDLSSFPANGMTYVSPNNCGCAAFLPGTNTFNSDKPAAVADFERLEKGPAFGKVVEGERVADADAWPMYMRDARRSSWTTLKISPEIKLAWSRKVYVKTAPDVLQADWEASAARSGSITPPVVAGKLGVTAVGDRHTVLAFDPASGETRWSFVADGRIDSSPTLYRGLVLFGTRAGSVYALQATEGELVWRFAAAPSQRMIVANGQAESLWPVWGSVLVEDDTVHFTAGRNLYTDGGIWLYALDPASGKVKHSSNMNYRLEGDIKWANRGQSEGGSTSPLVSDGSSLFLSNIGFDKKDGTVKRPFKEVVWNPAGYGLLDNAKAVMAQKCVVPGAFGFQFSGRENLGLNGAAMHYAGVKAKLLAYNGRDIVALLGSDEAPQNRNGNNTSLRRWKKRLEMDRDAKGQAYSELVWDARKIQDKVSGFGGRDYLSFNALAVAGDYVLVGKDKSLRVYNLADGKFVGEAALPAPICFGGIAVASGQVFVSCTDGNLLSLR